MTIYLNRPAGGSDGGSYVARQLGYLRLRGAKQLPRNAECVVAWGTSAENPFRVPVVNGPKARLIASNKTACLDVLAGGGVNCLPFTTSRATAEEWKKVGHAVVVRHTVTGQAGAGIEVIRPTDVGLPAAPLYTQFVKSKAEYRVHVVGNAAIACKKARRNDAEPEQYPIRNHGGRYTFKYHLTKPCPQYVVDEAIRAVRVVGLDFGAVDILDNGKMGCVIEINTAPGLDHTVAKDFYVEHIPQAVRRRLAR